MFETSGKMTITLKGFFYFLQWPLLSEPQAPTTAVSPLGTGESTYHAGLNVPGKAQCLPNE